jgi:biotin transport system ATP-binding protein
LDIRFSNCAVRFKERVALHPFSLTLSERRIGIIGLNGSGKTTFSKLINGLVKPSEGTVTINGHDTVTDAKAVLSLAGFIFQNPQHQLIMPVVREDLAFGLKAQGLGKDEIDARIEAALNRFGIAELADRRVFELSGGETQLAAIASVTVTGPEILIFDEPVNQLDIRNRQRVLDAIQGLTETAIVISHDLPLIEDFDRVLVFHEGRIAFDGAAMEAIARYREIAGC